MLNQWNKIRRRLGFGTPTPMTPEQLDLAFSPEDRVQFDPYIKSGTPPEEWTPQAKVRFLDYLANVKPPAKQKNCCL